MNNSPSRIVGKMSSFDLTRFLCQKIVTNKQITLFVSDEYFSNCPDRSPGGSGSNPDCCRARGRPSCRAVARVFQPATMPIKVTHKKQ